MVVWALMLSADDKSVWPDPVSSQLLATHPLTGFLLERSFLHSEGKMGCKNLRVACMGEVNEEEIQPHGRKEV